MGHLLVRHLDDAVIERLILRAEALGVPVEVYLRKLLTEAVQEAGEEGLPSGTGADAEG